MKILKKSEIPAPAIERLCRIYTLISSLHEKGEDSISSSRIGELLDVGAHNIRKDISFLGETGTSGSGYNISKLKDRINHAFLFNIHRKACIVGLGGLGGAILNYKKLLINNFDIVAGFDSNINKLDTLKTSIAVYPSYTIKEIVQKENIELAVITVPENSAREISKRLIEAGIKGIINFSPVILNSGNSNVFIKNIDLVDEFRHLAALISLHN